MGNTNKTGTPEPTKDDTQRTKIAFYGSLAELFPQLMEFGEPPCSPKSRLAYGVWSPNFFKNLATWVVSPKTDSPKKMKPVAMPGIQPRS